MKKGKVVILPMYIASMVIIFAMIVGLFVGRNQTEKNSIFAFKTVGQVLDAGHKRSIDDSFKFTGIEEFGYIGDGQIDAVSDDSIDSIWFVSNLSTNIGDESAKELVTEFVNKSSKKLNLSFSEKPIKLQYCDDETYKNLPEDENKALAEGYILFEYSCRDKDGVLWILQAFSPQENYLNGLIVKQINESEFEGYEPQVDMRKE